MVTATKYSRRLSIISFEPSKVRRFSTFDLATMPKIGTIIQNDDDKTDMKPIDWFRNSQYYLICLCYVTSRLIYVISTVYTIYYVHFTLQLDKKFIAIVPLVMFTSGFAVAAIVEIAKKRVSMKVIFVTSCVSGLGNLLRK